MRTLKTSFLLLLLAVFVSPVMAEDGPAGRPERGEFRQELLEEFDEDGNGQLDNAERTNAREKMRGRRGKDGAKGRRGGRGDQGPPNPEELFNRFDADGDNQLSREEFRKLAKSMREHREKHRQGKGPRGEGPGRGPGPLEDNRRDFRPSGPLQNPGDRPPRAEKGRGGKGGPEGRPGGRGFEGRRPPHHGKPDPDKIFNRFDKNDDGQLSREEFGKLSQAMREMRDRFRGDRRGPPGKGKPDRSRPPELDENTEDDSA